jgi:hypothetical protein
VKVIADRLKGDMTGKKESDVELDIEVKFTLRIRISTSISALLDFAKRSVINTARVAWRTLLFTNRIMYKGIVDTQNGEYRPTGGPVVGVLMGTTSCNVLALGEDLQYREGVKTARAVGWLALCGALDSDVGRGKGFTGWRQSALAIAPCPRQNL